MNVSIYNRALKIVNILAAFCVFQFSRIALNNNNTTTNKNQPTLLRNTNRVTQTLQWSSAMRDCISLHVYVLFRLHFRALELEFEVFCSFNYL